MFKLLSVAVLLVCLTAVVNAHVEAQAMPNFRKQLHQEAVKLGLTADVTATLEESLFSKICAAVLPAINEIGKNLVIPGQSEKHFSFGNVVVQDFNVAGLSITFAAPDKISVAITGLTFSIPKTDFRVFTKIIFKISCSGDFWASLGATSIVLTLPVSEAGGKLTFGTPTTNVQWGALNVGHELHDVLCKVGQDIIQLFIGNLNTLIHNLVEKDLPAKIGPPIEAALNKALAKLPLDIVSAPAVTSNSISVTVDLLGGAGSTGVRAAVGPFRGHQVRSKSLAARDVMLEIPAVSVDNILLFIQQRGLLNVNFTDAKFNTTLIETIFPSVYSQCPGCPFAVEVMFPTAPVVQAGSDSLTLQLVNTVFGLNIVKANSADIAFVDLYVNATLTVTGLTVNAANKVYFQLQLAGLTFSIDHSAIGPFVPDLISSLVTFLLKDIVVPDFNKKFQGIDLGKDISNGEIDVASGNVEFGFDLVL